MEAPELKRKKRALTSDAARLVRQQGHDDAREFALAIGMLDDYRNNPAAKKDVVDPSGDTHSVKSGQKKWQIFLYSLSRFQNDSAFKVMEGSEICSSPASKPSRLLFRNIFLTRLCSKRSSAYR